MTMSSGLGPANGSAVVGAAALLYGREKRLDPWERDVVEAGLLNMVLAKSDGAAWSSAGPSMGTS